MQKNSLVLCQIKRKKKINYIFTLVPLATCGAFPVSMVMMSESFGARERETEINTRASSSVEMINDEVFASASDMSKQKHRAICRMLCLISECE